jgi:hemoglobin
MNSTGALHSYNRGHRDELVQKLGGEVVLREAVDDFYKRLVSHPTLQPFFEKAHLDILKWHQFNILSFAFVHKPEHFDAEKMLLPRHKFLFEMGLNEEHFDVVMSLFDETMNELKVDPAVAAEGKTCIESVRAIFVKGAAMQREAEQHASQQRWLLIATVSALVTTGCALLLSQRGTRRDPVLSYRAV